MTAAPERPGRAIGRFAAWMALAHSLLMAAPALWGEIDVAGALVAATWSASPAYGAALFAIASAGRGGAAFYRGVELLVRGGDMYFSQEKYMSPFRAPVRVRGGDMYFSQEKVRVPISRAAYR